MPDEAIISGREIEERRRGFIYGVFFALVFDALSHGFLSLTSNPILGQLLGTAAVDEVEIVSILLTTGIYMLNVKFLNRTTEGFVFGVSVIIAIVDVTLSL